MTDLDAQFTELYLRFYRSVFGVCYAQTARWDVAEELTQETYLRAWRALPRVTLDEHADMWLKAIARNLVRDYHKARAVRPVLVAWDPAWDRPDMETPEQRVLDDAAVVALYARIHALPPGQRDALQRQLAGQDLVTIGRALGSNAGAVKVLLWRARQALRRAGL